MSFTFDTGGWWWAWVLVGVAAVTVYFLPWIRRSRTRAPE